MSNDDLISNEEDELITVREGCAIIGGKGKPVSPATFYRGVHAGRYTAPVHPSPGISRLKKKQLLKDHTHHRRRGRQVGECSP